MGVIKVGGLVIVSFLLLISLVLFSVVGSFEVLLYPDVYINSFDKNNVYGFFDDSSGMLGEGRDFIEIPDGGFKPLLDELINNLLSYLRGDSEELDLSLEVDTSSLRNFFLKSVESFPVCNAGQQPFVGEEIVCRPSEISASDFLDEVLAKKNMTILEGGKIDLAGVYGFDNPNIEKIRSYTSSYKIYYYGIVLLGLIFLVIIFLLNSKSFSPSMKWAGVVLFLAGIFIVVSSSTGFDFALSKISFDLDFAQGVIADVSQIVADKISVYGWVIMIIGVLFFAGSFLLRKEEK